MQAPRISSGSASAPPSKARRTWSSSAASPIRSASNAPRAWRRARCCACSTGSTPSASRAAEALPPLLDAVAASGRPVLWACDPMHGNTLKTAAGTKTRPLELVFAELRAFFALAGPRAGGVHVEMTGRNVTECTGGETRLTEADLADRYHSHCDPRLNPAQAMELAELVAKELAGRIPVLA